MYRSTDIIKTVRLTEKASTFRGARNKYVFEVSVSANKVQIRRSVETLFGKRVFSVNTSNQAGKVRRKGSRQQGFASDWKKAVVTLVAGESLDIV